MGSEVRNHRLKRSVDLVVSKDGEDLFFVECEIKTALDEEFKYDDLQLPERKSKFIGMELPTLFMLFSSTGDRYFCVWGRFVEKSPLEEVSNRHIRSGEFFYKIPLTDCDTKLADALKR